MGPRLHSKAALFATLLTAAIGLLQPGIDPVFLTLLSAAHPVAPQDHGWIVGATQAGMALGSLIVWRAGARLAGPFFLAAALLGFIASLATARTGGLAALLAIRAGYGFAMGTIYTRAMSAAAGWRPNGAYGAVFLIQLLLSTLIALVLPPVADAAGPGVALGALAVTPLAALLLMLRTASPAAGTAQSVREEKRHAVDPSAWAIAAASLLFISATMMVWSFAGALAIAAQIDEGVIGQAVALGSIVGAGTALLVMRETPLVPLPVTGLFSGLCLLAPIPAAASADDRLYILSVVLLNIGSTAIIIRTSGMASARCADPLFRRLVASTHAFGMILGPVAGSMLTTSLGERGLLGGGVVTIAAGCLALLLAGLWGRAALSDAKAEVAA